MLTIWNTILTYEVRKDPSRFPSILSILSHEELNENQVVTSPYQFGLGLSSCIGISITTWTKTGKVADDPVEDRTGL